MYFIVLLFCSTSSGFLLEKETATGPGGNSLSDQHYIYLLGLLTQEKGNVQQMENFMLKLNNEVQLLHQVQRNGSSQVIVDLKNELNQVKREINQMKNENSALAKTNEMLRNEIHMCSNKTMKLQKELQIFTHSNISNITQIQSSVETLEHKVDTTTAKLNLLASQSNARSQDFLALLDQTRDTQHKLAILDSETKQRFQNYQQNSSQTIDALETRTKSADKKINDVFRQLTAINQTVVLTSCGKETRSVTDGSVIKFANTKTVYGISDIDAFKSSGKFVCEVPGVYLFSVFIESNSSASGYTLYKNNDVISYVYFFYNGGGHFDNRHTGTGIVAVSLSVGDTLYVTAGYDMYIYGSYSCMTVVKIR